MTAKPPEPANKPWYADYLGDNPNLLYALGGILLLIGGWALSRFLRKPKPMVRPQYANDSGALVDGDTDIDHADADAQERHLLDQLAEHPNDVPLSLELLRHYYVQGDSLRFEALAESLRPHVDENSVDWQEVLAMGEGLSPHHPLFAAPGTDTGHVAADATREFSFDEPALSETDLLEVDPKTQRFDFHELEAQAHAAQVPGAVDAQHDLAAADHEFAHDHEHDNATPAAHEAALDEFLVDEDTVGTRLDLARAYLDMGDPDGARSMLDEVLAEGNEVQKEEARKLLAELH